jgi:CelD/BcsL family acetyltransferase involved in cellulose biosynthesis
VSKILALLCSVLPEAGADWERLSSRAAPNVFMSPAALSAAAPGNPRLKVVHAWKPAGDGGCDQLVGLWALKKKRLLRFGPATMSGPPYDYAFVSNPVVAGDEIAATEAAAGALVDALRNDRTLPRVLRLKDLDADADSYRALAAALAKRGLPSLVLAEHMRPFATRLGGVKSSGSTRKKLRQDWNRLSALGPVDIVNETAPDRAQAAFETFLAMEAASWKGANGTALLSDAADAAFVRRLFANLCVCNEASVALLRVGGRPVAAQVLFYSAQTAYTWKTAFDAEFSRFSPGALLIDKMTEQLFASGRVEAIESCSPRNSFMAQLWSGRRRTVDLLIDLSGRRSTAFRAIVLCEQAKRRLRSLRDDLRAAQWLPDPRGRARA